MAKLRFSSDRENELARDAIKTYAMGEVQRLDQRIDDSRLLVKLSLEAAEKAVLKAETAASHRFQSVNAFREQLRDQAATLLPRAEFIGLHDVVLHQLDEHRDAIAVIRQQIAVGPNELHALAAEKWKERGEEDARQAQIAMQDRIRAISQANYTRLLSTIYAIAGCLTVFVSLVAAHII